ncbi:TonB-dependent receptor [Lacinutrix sp. MedPE-SW]|uniref:TonB-dependent receptor n=1 Tax=Lacinutrix sp. MedPE-SW TaxID=1860087 RepID=UPI0009156C49|nr:TonB-dependent receptor [Lacinutrix sp. MedPE-SW]OIQ23933.1 MAG: TonB-dependent receptor [Lacinutrix sp. MedPE-SW]
MRFLTLILFFIGCFAGISQNCNNTFSGKIIDSHDNTALVDAKVEIIETNQTVLANADGTFSITNLCDSKYTIQISHPFCITQTHYIDISKDLNKVFWLEHHLEELNEIIIKGNHYNNKTNTTLESKISKDELERYSSFSLGDALNGVSGVSSLNTGNAIVKPLINGLHSSRVVMMNNGVRMEDQDWGAEHAPNVDINAVDNITVIKGASALQYSGNAIGGIIITETAKAPVKDTLYGKTIITGASNGRGGTITSQLTKSFQSGWFAKAQGTLKRFGDFEAPNYNLSNTGVFERNFSLSGGLNKFNYGIEAYYSLYKSEIGILRASHLGGAQDQVRAINNPQPLFVSDFSYDIDAPKQDVEHHLATLKGFKKLENLGRLSFQYDYQQNKRLEFDIRRGDDKDKPSLDLNLQTHTLLFDLDSKLSNKSNLKTGVMAKYQNNFADPNTGVRRLIPDYDKYDLGAYAVYNSEINNKVLLELGARFDYTHVDALKFYRTSFWESRNYDTIFQDIVIEGDFGDQVLANPKLNFYNPSATAGFTYKFNNTYKLLFNYSLASRAPNPSELFSEGLHHSASRIEYGDLQFKSETANKISLTLQRESNVFNFSINPYINFINDFIVIEPTGVSQTIRGNFQVWEYRQTNAQLIGLDIDAAYNFANNFQYNHQFSLVKGYDKTRDEALINIPPVNIKNEVIYKNSKLNNLRLKLQSDYVFEQNEYPNNNFEVFVPETGTMETVDVSTPPDAYHLLNFSSSIDFKINKGTAITVGFDVSNIFNKSYRNYLNRLRYYADDLGRNFLINLKINY